MDREGEGLRARAPVAAPAPAEPAQERADLGTAATTVAAPGFASPAGVLALQRSAGNAAVTALLRQPTAAPPAPSGVYNPLQEGYDTARKEREQFIAQGKKGPQTYNPSTNNKDNYYGGFDVEYDPAKGAFTVTLKGAVLFVAGMTLDPATGRAQAVEPSPQTAAAAAAINKLPKAKRPAEVAKWSWSSAGGPDANDEQEFLDNFKSSVQSAWSKKHPFYCTKKYWEDLGAETQVKVEIGKVAAAAGKAGDQHMLVNAHKVVKGFIGGAADVSRPASGGGGPFGNVMNVTSEDATPRKDGLLESTLHFQSGKVLLTVASVGTVWRLAKEMPNAKPGSTVPVANLTVRIQGKDDAQRRARFQSVCDQLRAAAGFDTSRAVFEDGGEGEGGHITVGTGDAQTVVAHESGHMFGLDDEYTGPGAYAPGKKTEHTDFAAASGHTGAMHAKSDSIMSEGTEVRAHHYVTFLDALKTVSGMPDWGYGPTQVVKPPSAAGDYPVPGTPGGGPQTGTAVA